jgi:glutamyl-tRNA synthetase
MIETPELRIAPTPSGYLHKGNLVNFLLIWVVAKAQQGKILLRIDDLDSKRVQPRYIDDIFRAIDELGIDYDSGPQNVRDFETSWSQHLRLDLYKDLCHRLKKGGFLYRCSLSRREAAALLLGGTTWHDIRLLKPADEHTPWRYLVRTPVFEVTDWTGHVAAPHVLDSVGDVVVIKQDGLPAYQIANIADDVFFGITHVVRGQDLLPSTAVQLMMAADAGVEQFSTIQWWHHPLVTDQGGVKLSKSAGAQSEPFEIKKHLPDLISTAASVLGLDPKSSRCTTLSDLLELCKTM